MGINVMRVQQLIILSGHFYLKKHNFFYSFLPFWHRKFLSQGTSALKHNYILGQYQKQPAFEAMY